jgi:hypothetical protein
MVGREHLHHDDTPSTLAILSDLLDHRCVLPDGYEPTDQGAWVDWDALGRSWLSSTEVAAVHIARGCAIAELQGGLPFSVAGAVHAAVGELTRWSAMTSATDISDPADFDGLDVEDHGFAEPVGLDPYHPDQPNTYDDLTADGRGGGWWDGPDWSYRRAAHHRGAERPESPGLGWGLDF